MENVARRVAVFDCETEPFDGVTTVYRPFAIGFYDGNSYRRFWGADAPYDFVKFLRTYPERLVLYAHNGGKFDFLFFLRWIEGQILLINSRITKAALYHHELRDSYSIIPEPLASFRGKNQKSEIDYEWMKPQLREQHKDQICAYLKDDVMTLYEGVMHFRGDFGDALTIGMAAMKEFKKFYKFERLKEYDDKAFRHFYFGGRCQCFKVGVFRSTTEPFKIYDVNSMYAAVMKNYRHPISAGYDIKPSLSDKTTFACIEAENDGALPQRIIGKGNIQSLDFTVPRGRFFAGIHEIRTACDLGLLRIKKIHYAIEHHKTDSFGIFVDWVTEKKIEMEKRGETAKRNNYKRVGNSCYGKFAQDPGNYSDNLIARTKEIPPPPWEPSFISDEYTIYSKPSERHYYNNVSIGASITSAARATLLLGLSSSTEPHYCDTDSVICKRFEGDIDPMRLGAWKFETKGDMLAIAGKKSYVLRAGSDTVKMASKGVPLKHAKLSDTIIELASDPSVSAEIPNPIPAFKLDGHVIYTTRRIRATGKAARKSVTPSKQKVEANKRDYGCQ